MLLVQVCPADSMDCRFVVSVVTLEYSAGTNHVDCNVQFVAWVSATVADSVIRTRLGNLSSASVIQIDPACHCKWACKQFMFIVLCCNCPLTLCVMIINEQRISTECVNDRLWSLSTFSSFGVWLVFCNDYDELVVYVFHVQWVNIAVNRINLIDASLPHSGASSQILSRLQNWPAFSSHVYKCVVLLPKADHHIGNVRSVYVVSIMP